MNYELIYNRLCIRGKFDRLCDGVFETHHITPKCLGGNNCYENLTKLTPREHFIAHLLLTKIYKGNSKLVYAFNMMLVESKNHNRYIPNSKYYEIARKHISEYMKTNNPMKNEKSLERMKNTRKRKISEGIIIPHFPKESERKMHSERMKTAENPTKKFPEKHNFRNNSYTKGTFWWTDGKINKRSIDCPGETFIKGVLKKKW